LVTAGVTVLVLALAPPAAAHASLIDTDPDEGAVLEGAPDVISFTFDEPVGAVPDGVKVFDATGTPIESSSTVRGADLLVTLDEHVGDGTLVVAWRVVSDDGHPVSGSLTFSIGAPSQDVVAQAPDGASAGDVPVALSLSRWPAYTGLLLAVGLVWFATMTLPAGLDETDRARRRLRAMARRASAVAVVAWLVGLPLTAVYLRGTGFTSILENVTWQGLPTKETVLTAVVVCGLLSSVVLLPSSAGDSTRRVLAAAAALIALAPLPLSGHSSVAKPADLVVVVDGLHLVAGATWLGGLVGLVLTIPVLTGRSDATAVLVSRFSTSAAAVLALLVLTGALLAWRIVGSWRALFTSGYGQLLLVKIALVAMAVAIASYNRFRLVPRVRNSVDVHHPSSTRALARTVTAEVAALVTVLLITGFLVDKNPPSGPAAIPTAHSPDSQETALGDLRAVVTLTPASAGTNTLSVRIQDGKGGLAAGVETPRLRVSSGDLDLGEVPLEPADQGRYQGIVVLPHDGTWQVQISLRVGPFDNPVGSVTFQVVTDVGHVPAEASKLAHQRPTGLEG
jgi:copper transport protein